MVRKLPKYLFAHPSQLTHDTQTGPQVAQQQPPRTDKHVRFLTSDGVVAGGVYGPAPPPAPTPQFNWCSPAARPPATVPKKSQRRKVVADSPAPKTSLGGKNSLDGKNNLRGRNWNWTAALTAIGVLLAGWWVWSSRTISGWKRVGG